LDLHWNISEYLPPKVSKNFTMAIGGYLNKIYNFMQKITEEDITEIGARVDEFKEKALNFRKKYIAETLSYLLFERIPKINEEFKENQVNFFLTNI